jgi:hypothetical protein
MNNSEILSRTINCKWATGDRDHSVNEAVWKGEAWLKEHGSGDKDDVDVDVDGGEGVKEENPV